MFVPKDLLLFHALKPGGVLRVLSVMQLDVHKTVFDRVMSIVEHPQSHHRKMCLKLGDIVRLCACIQWSQPLLSLHKHVSNSANDQGRLHADYCAFAARAGADA